MEYLGTSRSFRSFWTQAFPWSSEQDEYSANNAILSLVPIGAPQLCLEVTPLSKRWQTGFLSQAECHVPAQGHVLVGVALWLFKDRCAAVAPSHPGWRKSWNCSLTAVTFLRQKEMQTASGCRERSEQPPLDSGKETPRTHPEEMSSQGWTMLVQRMVVPFHPLNKIC